MQIMYSNKIYEFSVDACFDSSQRVVDKYRTTKVFIIESAYCGKCLATFSAKFLTGNFPQRCPQVRDVYTEDGVSKLGLQK